MVSFSAILLQLRGERQATRGEAWGTSCVSKPLQLRDWPAQFLENRISLIFIVYEIRIQSRGIFLENIHAKHGFSFYTISRVNTILTSQRSISLISYYCSCRFLGGSRVSGIWLDLRCRLQILFRLRVLCWYLDFAENNPFLAHIVRRCHAATIVPAR